MSAVEDGHVPPGDTRLPEGHNLLHHPFGLPLLGIGQVAADGSAGRQRRDEVLFEPVLVLVDEGVGRRQDLRRRAVVLHHHNGPSPGKGLVQVQKIFDVGATPGVDGLVRVSHHKEVFVIPAQHLHELVLERVDVLELVDHDVLQPPLPLLPQIRPLLENMEGKLDEVVVVQPEALFLLVEVAVKDHVLRAQGVQVLLPKDLQGEVDHVFVVIRLLEELADLDHVSGLLKGHVPQGEAALLVDDLEHGVDVGVVQDQEPLGIAHGAAVLLEDGDTEAVEGVDVAGVVVAGEGMDTLAHLGGGLVGKGDAEDVPRQDARLLHQKGKAVG